MNKEEIKYEINQDIVKNGLKNISGTKLNKVLNDIVDNADELTSSILYTEQELSDVLKLQAQANLNDTTASQDGKMGYKVLQPEKAGDPTTSFAAQIANKPNTIFEIRDVFDLDNGSVTIPANCTLKFNGGVVKNGTLTFDNTQIDGANASMRNIEIGTTSTIRNKEICLSWFCKEGEDCADVLYNICNVTNISNVFINLYDVKISHPVVINVRGRNIFGKEAFSEIRYDTTLQNMATITPTSDYSADGYERNAAFLFSNETDKTYQTGVFKNIKIDGEYGGAYRFGYGCYFCGGMPGGLFENNFITHCYIAGLVLYTTENTYVRRNRFIYCATGIFVSNRLIDETNILNMNAGADFGADNWLNIEENNISFCNYGIVGRTGSNTNIVRTGVNHCSCYAIYIVNYNIVNISQCYFEGNGKSTFWVSSSGIDGTTTPDESNPVMCSHLSNPHLGEDGGDTITEGWGVLVGDPNYTTPKRLRGNICLIGYGTTYFDTALPSTAIKRLTSSSIALSNDDTECGADGFFFVTAGQKLNVSNVLVNISNFVKYLVISKDTDAPEGQNIIINYENTNINETLWAGYVRPNSFNVINNANAISKNGNYVGIVTEKLVGRTLNGTKFRLSRGLAYNVRKNNIPFYELDKQSSNYTCAIYIPSTFFDKTKIVRFFAIIADSSTKTPIIEVGVNQGSLYNTATLRHSMSKEVTMYQYVVNPITLDQNEQYLKLSITVKPNTGDSITDFLPMISPIYINALDELPSTEIIVDGYDDRYMPTIGTSSFCGTDVVGSRSLYAGEKFTSTDLKKVLVYDGSADFLEPDGAKRGVKRTGNTANRPIGSSIYVGFQYLDTDLSPIRPIYASSISGDTVTWLDATGASV